MAVVLVVTSAPPLVEGGHLVLARALERALIEAGHRASIVTTPSNRFGRQGAAYLANWLTDVRVTGTGERVDQVISLRYPAYAVRHPAHVCWLVHTMREYYDLWDRVSQEWSTATRAKERVRRALIHAADTYCLRHHVTRLFTISRAVNERLARWNHVAGEVLLPPPPPRPYRCDGYGDYLFAASRLTPLKRFDLLIRSLAEPAAKAVRCVVGGEGEDLPRLRRLAGDLGVADRVTFAGRLTEAALLDHLARCRAVVFAPLREDYGFATAEAFAAGKAVITCTDSGGPLELVRDGENGWVVPANPASLGAACVEAMDGGAEAARRGARAQADISRLSWAAVARTLVLR